MSGEESQKDIQKNIQKKLQKLIRELIQESILSEGFSSEIYIQSEDEIHFEVVVISEIFSNLSRVKRQQLVYASLSLAIMDGRIHAVALKTYTPEEWSKREENKK